MSSGKILLETKETPTRTMYSPPTVSTCNCTEHEWKIGKFDVYLAKAASFIISTPRVVNGMHLDPIGGYETHGIELWTRD